MRYYTFTNFMLSSIQQGIQPAHCIADTFIKYSQPSQERDYLLDWAVNHKTMICLNGGNADGIRQIYSRLHTLCGDLQLPYCMFREDQQSLDLTMTCCGLVVPAHIYEATAATRGGEPVGVLGLTPTQLELVEFLLSFGLAK